MFPEDTPDPREIEEMKAEMEAHRKYRARMLERTHTPEEMAKRWDKHNEQSIERGDGPLPF